MFCDWYLELIKPILGGSDEAAAAETRAMTACVLDRALKLLHPFMPFVTEELWAKLAAEGEGRETLLVLAPWPHHRGLEYADADAEIGWVIRLISEVRSVRSEMNVPAGAKVPLVISGASEETAARAKRHEETILRLARIDAMSFGKAPAGAVQIVLDEATWRCRSPASSMSPRNRSGSSARSTRSARRSSSSTPSSPTRSSSPARPSTWSRSSASGRPTPRPSPPGWSRP